MTVSLEIQPPIEFPPDRPRLAILYRVKRTGASSGEPETVPDSGITFGGKGFFVRGEQFAEVVFEAPEDTKFNDGTLFLDTARALGCDVTVVDPFVQPVRREYGSIWAYQYDPRTGQWNHRMHPRRVVLFDKSVHKHTPDSRQIFEGNPSINPPTLRTLTGDKLKFAHCMNDHGLGAHHPETHQYNPGLLEQLLRTRNDILLKPQYGLQMKGVMRITRRDNRIVLAIPTYSSESHGMVCKRAVLQGDQALNDLLQVLDAHTGDKPFVVQPYLDRADIAYPHNGSSHTAYPEFRMRVQRGAHGILALPATHTKLILADFSGEKHFADTQTVLAHMYKAPHARRMWDTLVALSEQVHAALESELHAPIGDVSVDISILRNNIPVVIEANALGGPAPTSHTDAMRRYNENIIKYALYLHHSAQARESRDRNSELFDCSEDVV